MSVRNALRTAGLLTALSLVPAIALAQNRLANPGFDTSLSGWLVFHYNPVRVSEDVDGSANSGSARAIVPGGVSQGGPVLAQCIPVTPGETVDFSFRTKVQQTQAEVGGITLFSSANCSAGRISGTGVYTESAAPIGQWSLANQTMTVPAGAQSAFVELDATTLIGGGSAATQWDDVYFGSEAPPYCTPGTGTLCLDDHPADQRFLVVSDYYTANGGGLSGFGNAISLSVLGVGQGGLFWFFSHANPELLVKVHDACASSSFFWVFVSAGTNAGVDLYVVDTYTGAVAYFHNPDLSPYPTIHDFLALPCN